MSFELQHEPTSEALAPSLARAELAVEDAIHIDFWVREPETVSGLLAQPEGRDRDEYARAALRIGVVALQHAQGRVDGDMLRSEGERLMESLEVRLHNHERAMDSIVTGTLKSYFDPKDGRFNERVERLIRKDGELESVLTSSMRQSARELDQELQRQVGPDSSIVRLLSPDDSNRLLVAVRSSIGTLITAEQGKILSEFSLDNEDGALARLVAELQDNNGALANDVKATVHTVAQEFSLDREDSALSRLVKRVEAAQRQISSEFTLDAEGSALSRMKRDLQAMIDALRRESTEFQQAVIGALEAMKARKLESFASTRHGKDFEIAAYSFIDDVCQKAGNIAEHTGDRTGDIKHCKVGDGLITLGPDSEAAGARVVCEMKEDASYDLQSSLKDLETARANRKAGVGLFVHSKRTAPGGLRPLARYGNDVVVVWDAEDEVSDAYLAAGIMVCVALAIRKGTADAELAADFDVLDKAIREVERQASYLDEIKTSSTTIRSGADKILNRVETMRAALAKEIGTLSAQAGVLRVTLGARVADA